MSTPILAVAPFALLLACIAFLPLVAPHHWERNAVKAGATALLALPLAAWLAGTSPHALSHALGEYASFLVLIGSLFVVSGSIHVSGDLAATPRNNVILLGLGAVLANLLGTTGASMLMIRLVLRTNSQRKHVAHVPFFFILIVSNCGGLLTPLGDPPLFLGYLRGVPFGWTLSLWPVWCVAVAWLLLLLYVVDARAYARERAEDLARDDAERAPIAVVGWRGALGLVAIALAVFLPAPWREIALVAVTAACWWLGGDRGRRARSLNQFSLGPVTEVAILFAGLFVTMVPALSLLAAHGRAVGLTQPWQFFLGTGVLSSLLDNAPTYLAFLSAAQGLELTPDVVGVPAQHLQAISAGAVLMGANTYIGNGPNFMVKAIADASGYRTATFFRHAGVAVLVLAPVYVFTLAWVSR